MKELETKFLLIIKEVDCYYESNSSSVIHSKFTNNILKCNIYTICPSYSFNSVILSFDIILDDNGKVIFPNIEQSKIYSYAKLDNYLKTLENPTDINIHNSDLNYIDGDGGEVGMYYSITNNHIYLDNWDYIYTEEMSYGEGSNRDYTSEYLRLSSTKSDLQDVLDFCKKFKIDDLKSMKYEIATKQFINEF